MKKIVLFGAGLSAGQLISYLNNQASKHEWQINIVDINRDNLERYESEFNHVVTHCRGIDDTKEIEDLISSADAVISMLPAFMHIQIAKYCISYKKSLFTASYITEEIKELESQIADHNLFFLFECGLDPGIDHMSAMQVLDSIRDSGGVITEFESFTGGLVAPDSDDNPWNYKFSWNPRNVVLAGSGSASKFLHNGKFKYIPYHQLFRRTEFIEIEGWGMFEGYANRDSLKYQHIYGLDDVKTLFRGTLRRMRFGRTWDVFVKLGLTDDTYEIEDVENMTYRQFINSFLPYNDHDAVELKLMHVLKIDQDSMIMEKLRWLGIFENKPIGLKKGSPAKILQKLLEEKWQMRNNDNDMVVMLHRFGYEIDGITYRKDAWMVECGKGKDNTAMAKTVGLPLAMAVTAWLKKEIPLTGLHIPIKKQIYEPILKQLHDYGIIFHEKEHN